MTAGNLKNRKVICSSLLTWRLIKRLVQCTDVYLSTVITERKIIDKLNANYDKHISQKQFKLLIILKLQTDFCQISFNFMQLIFV